MSFEMPGWVKKFGKSFIVISVNDWSGTHKIRVTPSNLAKYYAEEANSMSGCRTLAGHTGDWRPIDGLASFCLDYFKNVNISAMRREGIRHGIEPKF